MSKSCSSSSVVDLVEVEVVGWMLGYLEYASMRTSQLHPRKMIAWSTCTLLHGFSGSIQGWLASLGGLFWCSAQAVHQWQRSMMSASILGRYTAVRASCFIRWIPICPKWKSCRIWGLRMQRMMTLDPYRRHLWAMESDLTTLLKSSIELSLGG